MVLIITLKISFFWQLFSSYSVIKKHLEAEVCSHEYISPLISPSSRLCLPRTSRQTLMLVWECQYSYSLLPPPPPRMETPSPARCASHRLCHAYPRPLPPASAQACSFPKRSQPDSLACETSNHRLSPFTPLIPCLSLPSLYHGFPTLNGCQQLHPQPSSLLMPWVFQLFPQEDFGPF